ncbi:aldose epimerase family protein [Reinekea sp.]|jgi:aldose 1-epimerase|uniref:aldose epimerase family protein n=1 Tax=Reinekea sp. TaxID=1970455 RepID=UPI002A80F6B1|nr:aldose epimerase family protein [Reinekea sp.]
MVAGISEVLFGTLADGRVIKKYRLRNAAGAEATFTNLGAAWIGFSCAKDEPSLVLGCDTLATLIAQRAYLGSTLGRFANRIGQGRFPLQGTAVQLDINLPPHHIHGGDQGFSGQVWDSRIGLTDATQPSLIFSHHSADGTAGYPGNVEVQVSITLTADNRVRFEYKAQTDRATILNLSNHAYFNLNGRLSGSLAEHEFQIHASQFLESDEASLPTGAIVDVVDTVLDLQQWTAIYDDLTRLSDDRLRRASGFDHCFCFTDDQNLKPMASARSTQTGRVLTCSSTLPGLQFYSGNFLGGTLFDQADCYQQHGAFCFEPGYWPDAPNQPHFPNCSFDEHKGYQAIIEYAFTETDGGPES